MEGLVWSQGGSTAIYLEFISSHELGSAVSVDFSIMILTSVVHTFPPPSLTGFAELSQYLVVDLYIWFHLLLDEGSMMIVGAFINLITGEGQLGLPFHYF